MPQNYLKEETPPTPKPAPPAPPPAPALRPAAGRVSPAVHKPAVNTNNKPGLFPNGPVIPSAPKPPVANGTDPIDMHVN